jgi:hypothetical protein
MSYYLLGVGVVACAGGLVVLARRIGFVRRAERTQGTVVRVEQRRSRRGTQHFPFVRFVATDRRDVTFRSPTGTSRPKWAVGDAMPVRYLPDDPQRALVDGARALWGLPVALLLMGAAALELKGSGTFSVLASRAARTGVAG